MRKLWESSYDVVYGLLVLLLLVLDLIIRSSFCEALSFIIVFIGFTFVMLNIIRYAKDERINYIASEAGFYSFMLCMIIISIISFLSRYVLIGLKVSELFRYLLMLMWGLFSLIYSILRRKM